MHVLELQLLLKELFAFRSLDERRKESRAQKIREWLYGFTHLFKARFRTVEKFLNRCVSITGFTIALWSETEISSIAKLVTVQLISVFFRS